MRLQSLRHYEKILPSADFAVHPACEARNLIDGKAAPISRRFREPAGDRRGCRPADNTRIVRF